MIDNQTIERVVNAAGIVDVVGEFVSLKRRGVNYIARCPFHDEKTPSFIVSPGKNIFKCFGCGKAGNPVSFIMEHERLTYVEAIRYLGKKYNIEIHEKEQTAEDIARNNDRESMMIVSSYANSFFSDTLHNSEEGKAIGLSYFKERGFSKKTIEKFQLGYSPAKRSAFSDAALKAGYKEKFLVQTGLSISRDDGTLFDRFAGRVMFPIHSLSGRVIAFGGRILQTDKKAAKYLNSPDSDIYLKRNVLYGVYFSKQAISRLDKCYLVEGYTDVISMFAAGVENVVASSGTSLTDEQIKLIARFSENVTVLFDGDAAGIKASLRGIDMLLKYGLKVKVVLLPDGEDPDSFARTHSAEELYGFLNTAEQDFLSFKVNLLNRDKLNDPLKKAEIIHEIVNSISVIPDLITRSVYIRECSKTLEIEENVLSAEVAKNRKKQLLSDGSRDGGKEPATTAANHSENPETDPVPAQMLPAVPAFVSNIVCQEQEKELLMFMLKHGRNKLFRMDDDSQEERYICVDEYIIADIKNDDLELQNLHYKKIFEEYERLLTEPEHQETDDFTQYFIRHADVEISSATINLLTDTQMQGNDNYAISKIWNGTNSVHIDLTKAVPKALAVYKSKVLLMARHKLLDELKEATDNQFDILEKIKLLDEQRKFISDFLDRVIIV
ncbi:MAG: DNA primase [Prevotellaceae bacterium]|jgi:DNA primase|nr:DNA primase [Prevotellaceae bacterium]